MAKMKTGQKAKEVTPKVSERRTVLNQVVLFFVIGSVFGTYWEEILHIVTNFVDTGTFEWVSRRGLLYGPFSPVYGIGAVLIYLGCYRTKMGFWQCFLCGALGGGVLEFGLSVLQEQLFGTISWDYSDRWLNIGGRTTVPYMIVWGMLVAGFVRVIYPFVDRTYRQLQPRTVNIICAGLAVFLLVDITLSVVATARQAMRRAGDAADNGVEVMLDAVYNDERMRRTYSNARYVRSD